MKQLKAAAVCGLFCILAGGGAVAAEKELKTIRVGDDAKESLTSDPRMVYTYAEINYGHTELNDVDLSTDTYGVSGSFLVIPNVFVVGSFRMGEFSEVPVDITGYDLGVGGRFPLNSSLDLVGSARVVQQELDDGTSSEDDTGFEVAVGARMLVMDQIEVAGDVSYLDLFDEGNTTLNVSGLYHIIPLVSAGVDLGYGDTYGEASFTYGATVRFNFQ